MASNNKSKTNSGSGEKGTEPSNYEITKDGWGGDRNFMASHGLKMEPGGFEERKPILDGYHKVDAANAEDGGKKGESSAKKK